MRGITGGVSGFADQAYSASGNHNLQNDTYQSFSAKFSEEASRQKKARDRQMRELIRGLQQTPEQNDNPYVVTSKDRVADLMKTSDKSEKEEKKKRKPVHYNAREVAVKIQRAKTSVTAGQAVLSAKRKVLDLRRKITAGSGDPEELQLALNHAKRMEIVAKKKKSHLELEEMVQVTQERDERKKTAGESASDMRPTLVSAVEEKITRREDEVFREREEMIHEAVQESLNDPRKVTDEMLDELNEMLASFDEDVLKRLEETMEALSGVEAVDPHMSREEFENFRRKHRLAENKEIVKADMEYLKGMIRHQMESGSISGMQGVTGISGVAGVGTETSGMLIDMQV